LEFGMQTKFETLGAARFLRTLRVTTGVAVALEDARRRTWTPAATFMALAARGVDGWRFPTEGMLSGDGLLLATCERQGDGSGALVLQAQGGAGVTAYAGQAARVRVGDNWTSEGAFDRFGALRVSLRAGELSDTELARFEVELVDDAQ
jgi:hypothetical protein